MKEITKDITKHEAKKIVRMLESINTKEEIVALKRELFEKAIAFSQATPNKYGENIDPYDKVVWMYKNCFDKKTNRIDLSQLDFSEFPGNVDTYGMIVNGELDQSEQNVSGDLCQQNQIVAKNLYQYNQYVKGDCFSAFLRVFNKLQIGGNNCDGKIITHKNKGKDDFRQIKDYKILIDHVNDHKLFYEGKEVKFLSVNKFGNIKLIFKGGDNG